MSLFTEKGEVGVTGMEGGKVRKMGGDRQKEKRGEEDRGIVRGRGGWIKGKQKRERECGYQLED